MAGSISATTATIIAAGVAAGGIGLSAYQGVKSSEAQANSLKQQTQATQTAEAGALSTERKTQTAQNQATRNTPDISSIMAKAAQAAKGGVGSTMLTGSGGVAGGLNLGGGGSLLGK